MKSQKIKFQHQELNIYYRDDADESVIAEIFKWKEYKASGSIIKNNKNPILDAGAHIGVFSLYTKAINPGARVYALEPEKNNFDLLKKNLDANKFFDVKTFNIALAERTCKRILFISDDNINHSLLPEPGENQDSPRVSIQAYSFGDFLSQQKILKVGLLKMDIEGGEYEILESMSPEDFSKIENIILEYHEYNGRSHKDLEKVLRQNGFSVQIFPSRFEKGLGFMLARSKNRTA